MNEKVHRLCYVEGSSAYFTDLPLTKQWGDDWDDAPYEHNAGEPYHDVFVTEGEPRLKADIVQLRWEGPFVTPDDGHLNSPWSVQMINARQVAWLRTVHWHVGEPVAILAGTLIRSFVYEVTVAGGRVWIPANIDLFDRWYHGRE